MMQDLYAFEKIQRRATRLIICFKALPYKEILGRLTSLSESFKGGDLIITYKLITTYNNIQNNKQINTN